MSFNERCLGALVLDLKEESDTEAKSLKMSENPLKMAKYTQIPHDIFREISRRRDGE